MTLRGFEVINLTFTAAADLDGNIFVGFDGNKCGAGAAAKGINRDAIKSGERGDLNALGFFYVTAGASGVTVGNPVTSDVDGLAVAVGGGDNVNGMAMETASAGDLALIRFPA